MLTLAFMILLSFIITFALTTIMLVLSKKMIKDREKMITFECGFNSFKTARAPFSLKFFLFTIIFLIFDIEIALLLPLGFTYSSPSFAFMSVYALTIIIILIMGLIHEWNQGMLSWIL